ncbi:MAG: PD40 domain-containing protein [Bryobacterales bacterium]|nr:PD40 domain-containing protein [Bryobacterales bacterium]MBV9398542.1 PD40 domain-containing protein [Bryobacterales bacterium]
MRQYGLVLLGAAACLAAEPQPYFGEPSISPDASEIAFVSGGDIWTVAAKGGDAHLLVSHPATESRPLYSPDGKYLAFTSTRTGNGDVYLLTFATGELKRLTFDDSNELVEGWSPDSRWIYFSSGARDIGTTDIYRVNRDGGTAMIVSGDRYLPEYFAAPSPLDGVLALTARGFAGNQWWRKGHSHLDESEIWLRHEGSPARYERITEGGAKEAWPMWAKDGRSIYYMSDRSGAQNIWKRALSNNPAQSASGAAGLPPLDQGRRAVRFAIDGKPQQVTQFTNGRVLWPAISADGRAIVFERDFRIWKLDTTTAKAAPVEITRRGAPSGQAVQHISLNGRFEDLRLSPDGKKVAFVSHGEVFAAASKEGGDASRITHTSAPESAPAWSPDSRKLAYVSQRNGQGQVFLYDFATAKETQITEGPDDAPRFSPDGKSLAFLRAGTELRVLDLATKRNRVLAKGRFGLPPLSDDSPFAWSPDNRWVAYVDVGEKSFRNVWAAPVTEVGQASACPGQAEACDAEPRPISFLANTYSDNLAWSPDGKYLLFTTTQRTENNQVARIDLLPRTPRFREDQFRDLFRDPKQPEPLPATSSNGSAPEAPKPASATTEKPGHEPLKIVFDGIRERLSVLPIGLSVNSIQISPDGKTAVLVAISAGQQNLYSYSLDDLAREAAVARQLTSTPGRKESVQFSPDGKEVFYLERGSVYSVALDSRQPKQLAVNAEIDVDFASEKTEVFRQAWTFLRDQFFDPNFNGVDWNAVRIQYEPLIAGAATSDEMRRLLLLMIGELNASHLGANAPAGNAQTTTGRLGLRFDREGYENSGKLKVTEVIPLSPADVAGIRPGEVLEAVEGVAIDGHTNVDQLLDRTIGKRVSLTVSGREVPVQPVNLATERNLLYREWVNQNREYVAKISGGRLGYVHMQDMSQEALDRLALDLDAENQSREGVVIDIRNNNGGFVNAYALDVFARRPYLRMTERGLNEAPARTVLGQRALEAPTVLVVNQHSLSDAEDFTEGYRALGLGKVVGEPTAGWIIYTWNVPLLDGTVFRLPHSRIRTAAGDDMERRPRAVDVAASRPVGESYTGRDSQLDAAVKELLAELPARR